MQKAVILVGMMGSGKSSVGRCLAEQLGVPFRDTDSMLQNLIGRPVRQMFGLYGEESFREFEAKILKDLQPGDFVLSTGGGIILRPENWDELRRIGTTYYLRVAPETLISRLAVSKNRRPLLDLENWEDRLREILADRLPIYEQADHTVEVQDEAIEVVATKIRALHEGTPL